MKTFDNGVLGNGYTKEQYLKDIEDFGIETVWNGICEYVSEYGETELLKIDDFGELYEIALSVTDKHKKKNSGIYCTPSDVAAIMSKWLATLPARKVCDVACGTGNLILTYLDIIGENEARQLMERGGLYLYERDATALKICKTSLLAKYGKDLEDKIHDICCDFLDKDLTLPRGAKVISNPPYASFCEIGENWEDTDVAKDTKELYAVFMEKMIEQSEGSVIITPYSFLGGSKFYSLRKILNGHNGFIVNFDNVPGNIFCGKKHGIFNSNTTNSVRAAITVTENKPDVFGYKVSPMIRFRTDERENLLDCDVLGEFVYEKYQTVSDELTMFYKCDKRLAKPFEAWMEKSGKKLSDYLCDDGQYALYMPNTCRYYTVASTVPLNRNGQIELRFDDEDVFHYMYCMINSSFAYWHWRLYDGGITFSQKLLYDLPVFFDKLTRGDKKFFAKTAMEMIERSGEFIVTKNNVGVQENIKFPSEYRIKINKRIFKILGVTNSVRIMEIIHSNNALENYKVTLTDKQKEIMRKFYGRKTRAVYNKKERGRIWNAVKNKNLPSDYREISRNCPALAHRIMRKNAGEKNIQAAVFSECAYAQTIANIFGLNNFRNYYDRSDENAFSDKINGIVESRKIVARYAYYNDDKTKVLVQAGGCGGIDAVYIDTEADGYFTIEFKEASAKTSEHDLYYGADGVLKVTDGFKRKYPQFLPMLDDVKGLNFFDIAGKNEHGFLSENVEKAVKNNYVTGDKKADVVCTEDRKGNVVMIPSGHIVTWAAAIRGEIRPAGRNHAAVWTPEALKKALAELGATSENGSVSVAVEKLKVRKPRGGGDKKSGYKISPLFYVPVEDCTAESGSVKFRLSSVRQLKPTVSAIVRFTDLNYDDVYEYYKNSLN